MWSEASNGLFRTPPQEPDPWLRTPNGLQDGPKYALIMGQTLGFTYYIPSRARVIGISC